MANFFSKNLKFMREKKGLSQTKLAEKIGVNQTTIARWEDDNRVPTIDNAVDVANALNIPLPDLLGKDLMLNNDNSKNVYDEKIKELETSTGIKISYASDKSLTQEDYLAINQLVLNEMKAQEEKK